MFIVSIFNASKGETTIRSYRDEASMQKVVLKIMNMISDQERFDVNIIYTPEAE